LIIKNLYVNKFLFNNKFSIFVALTIFTNKHKKYRMTLTHWLLIAFLSVCHTAKTQIVPLFTIEFDSTCVPYTPLGNRFIINDALNYSWNFGNGTVINQKMPTYSYTQAGAFKLSLTITTHATDKMVNGLTITAIPSTWDDLGTRDTKPDLYYIVKDSSGTKVFESSTVANTFPPVIFPLNLLMKVGRTYIVEVWEYDDTGTSDFLCYIPITNSSIINTFSNGGGTVVLTSLTNNTSYTYSRDIRLYNQPTVKITSVTDTITTLTTLTANITGGVGGYYYYQWSRNGSAISGANRSTFTVLINGTYSVFVTNSNCTATSSIRVATQDIPTLQNIRLFPTPSVSNEKQTLSFSSIESKTVDLKITDISGKIIAQQKLTVVVGENTFDLPEIGATGFFFVHLLDKNKAIFSGKVAVF
jgi:hypothetical protein